MSQPKLVTGDDLAIPVTLKKDGVVFAIADTATVKARLVSVDHDAVYCDEIGQSKDTTGADWSNSLVVVVVASTDTVDMTHQGLALLEIQVDDDGKRTWFVIVNIVTGNID